MLPEKRGNIEVYEGSSDRCHFRGDGLREDDPGASVHLGGGGA